ncbi:type IV toxin-antitoxin system AbiEi family antitoxin domain-containing protein [Kocuria flava]|uniref:DUF559 domain-containing protein n=1 Tax=Kocuria flava TaxID=446860 RepID=A0A2N4T4Y7_9MICC|nr:type IV toxin-antitoxin system AbiEi family antitoxin domain-containing protein [Kocuria flava]PLC13284.1 hypothetical protein AUQ48_15000 [Kocuria flava]
MTALDPGPGTDLPPLLRTADLQDAGLGDRAVHRQVQEGRLVRLRAGWYVRGEPYRALWQEDRMLLGHLAYARSSTVDPVLCHASAALVHGLRLYRVPTRIHTVSAPGHGTHNGAPDVVRHQEPLPPADVVEVRGIRVTSAERTLLDCARLLPFTDAVVLADQASAVRLTRARLERRLPEWRGRRGVRRAHRVLCAMDVRAESVGETLTRLMLAEWDLPEPRLQWVIDGRSGRYRADLAWPEHRVVLEFDGRLKYAHADPEVVASVLRDERRREVEIQELGWTVIRIGWKDVVSTPETTVARIKKALQSGGRRP